MAAASLSVAVEISETVCKRQDHIASKSIVACLLVIVGLIRNAEVFRLVQNIIRLCRQSKLVLEQKF